MKEAKSIEAIEKPNTRESLVKELQELGVKKGMTLIVHSSLSSLGWVCGGPIAVVQALIDAVGSNGTLVMPTQTADNSDPENWENPPVPESWWEVIRENMPAFSPEYTPTRGMGAVVETFRTYPGTKRSNHPTYSFAAWGRHADYIVSEQPLEMGFGENSPLAKIFELNGHVLLLGVSHENNTSLHLAEHSIPKPKMVKKGTAIFENGVRVWKEYYEIEYDSDVFEKLGEDFEKLQPVIKGKVGNSRCKLINQKEVVTFARGWLNKLHQNV